MNPILIKYEYYTDRYSRNYPHEDDCYIGYTLSGEGVVSTEGKEYGCSKGHIFIVPPGMSCCIRTAPEHKWEIVGCWFSPVELWTNRNRVIFMDFPAFFETIAKPQVQDRIESAFLRMIGYANKRDLLRKDELTINALEEVILLMANQETEAKPSDPRIRELLVLLNNHYKEPLHIDDLAQKVCLSSSRLSHLFKEQTGESIIERLTRIRLQYAEKRLLSTTNSIIEIAMESGFNSPEHFTRQFVKHYNMSPNQYRKSR